jgi:hypothetical protein
MNVFSMLVAPFQSVAREIRSILSVPLAFFGGIIGMIIMVGGMVAFFVFMPSAQAAEQEEEWDIDFDPGALVRIGKEYPEDEKVITEETVAREEPVEEEPPPEEPVEEEEAVQEEVTKKDDKPIEKKKEPTKKKPKKITPKPSRDKPEDKPPDTKKSDKNTKKNTPYDDLPTATEERGDPFGDAQGWADLKKDGDPWATAVMKALNNLAVGTWAAQSIGGTVKFKIQVCKDGRVSKVYKKGGSAGADGQNKVVGELRKLKLPKPPAKYAKKMKSPCQTIPYQFTYGNSGRVN